MMSCKKTTRLVSEELDHDLVWHKRIAVRLHVMMCRRCAAYKRQLGAIEALIRKAHRRGWHLPAGGPGLSDEARERIKAALRKLQ